MLPSVSPLTSSPKNRLQFTGGRSHKKRVRPTGWWAALRSVAKSAGLRDPDEDSLDRVVDAERMLDEVSRLGELHGQAQQRDLDRDVRLLDLRANLRSRRGA